MRACPLEPLAEYALRLYASQSYLAAHPPIRSLADLHAHPLVFYVDALLTVRELDLVPVLGGMHVGFGSTNVFAQLEATRRGAGDRAAARVHGRTRIRRSCRCCRARSTSGCSSRWPAAATTSCSSAVAIVREALHREVRERAHELVPPVH